MVQGIIDFGNSTSTDLSAGVTFTGARRDLEIYSSITISIKSDQDSAPSGVRIQYSPDETSWVDYAVFTYNKNSRFRKDLCVAFRYFRIIYENNSTDATTDIFIQTKLSPEKSSNTNDGLSTSVKISSNQLDSFGRLKVSEPKTLLDITHTTGKNTPLENEDIVGTATSTYNENESTITMAVSANLDSIIRQSRKYAIYQPGKSLSIFLTGVLDPSGANASTVTTQIGYYDVDNGIGFSATDGILSIFLRTSTSGSPVDNVVLQSSWNLDKMDGTGTSGIDIDISKTQIFALDLEWLGVGKVRVGFVVEGNTIYCHQFLNANRQTTTYMTSANLPTRYEISSTGGAGTMTQICTSVQSDGGYSPSGKSFSASRGVTPQATASNVIEPFISLRLRGTSGGSTPSLAAQKRTNIELKTFTAIATANEDTIIELWLTRGENVTATVPIGTGTSWNNVNSTDSSIQFDTASTTFGANSTNSTLLQTIYLADGLNQGNEIVNTSEVSITTNIDGDTSDVLTLAGTAIGSAGAYLASLNWREVF